jgi:hypothetical protein
MRGTAVTHFDEAIETLRQSLTASIKKHSPLADSFFFNGGTVVALAATGTATLLPESMSIWARIAAAIATFVIALSRALDFGGRWRWHIQMGNEYTALLDRVNGLEVLQDAEQREAAKKIFEDLAALRTKENGVPGSGSGVTSEG